MVNANEVVIKMVFLVSKKCKIFQFSTQWQQKVKYLQIILKFHPTNWENAFKVLNYQFCYLSSTKKLKMYNYPAKSGILQSPSCVSLFVSRISHKLLVGFWWNLVSREVIIIGRPSSKLGVIWIEIRIWDPDNCFSWTTGRILIVGKYSQSFSAKVVHKNIQLIPTMTCARVDEWFISESREMEIVGSITGDNR